MENQEEIKRVLEMAMDTFPGDVDAIDRGMQMMRLMLSTPWGEYSQETEKNIRTLLGNFGEKPKEVILAGSATTMAGYPGPCGDFLNPAAFVRVEIRGVFEKPKAMSFGAVAKGTILDCHPSHRHILMVVDSENYRIYATT